MKAYYWQGNVPNFGDDLNGSLWRNLAPELFADETDGVSLVGIGTVLFRNAHTARLTIVLGSGAGYGLLPSEQSRQSWRIYALRGPWTARALHLPEALAVTDPAILLPLVQPKPKVKGGPVFVPHWTTASQTCWRDACYRAGIDFIDPRGDAAEVVAKIASSSLVVAESLHGAIVADAYRVPWIPIAIDHYAPFKWHDWCASLEIEYRPVYPGTLKSGMAMIREQIRGSAHRRDVGPEECLRRLQTRSFGPPVVAGTVLQRTRRIETMVDRAVNSVMQPSVLAAIGARRLKRVLTITPNLSEDSVLENRQTEMLARLALLRRDHDAGILYPGNVDLTIGSNG